MVMIRAGEGVTFTVRVTVKNPPGMSETPIEPAALAANFVAAAQSELGYCELYPFDNAPYLQYFDVEVSMPDDVESVG